MPSRDSDITTLMRRLDALEEELARGLPTAASPLEEYVGKIADVPPSAMCYYTLDVQTVGGDEVEGGAGTLTDANQSRLAMNLGSSIPPVGTPVVCTLGDGGRWVFRYG